MTTDIVCVHIDAAWNSDWQTLRNSLADHAKLTVKSGQMTHTDFEIGGLYRFVSQAWDFLPGTVHLNEKSDGIVEAEMCLTNGGGWTKNITGRYHVQDGRIDVVEVTDSLAAEGNC